MSDELVAHLRPASVATPDGAIVLLHGRGADELDLVPLLDALDPHGRLVGAFPRGPLALPPGGAHWYVVPRVGYPDPASFDASLQALSRWIGSLPEHTGVPLERTVIGGFSQGAVMAYALAFGAGRAAPAALMALSGFIPTVPGFELDLASRLELPVAIAHGTLDPVISVEFGRAARRQLEEAGLRPLYRETAVPHTIDPRVIAELGGWLRDQLGTNL